MADLYRLKVFYNSTSDLSGATFLQYTYASLNYPNYRSFGVGGIMDTSGNLTSLGNTYKDNGFFNIAYPYVFTSDADNSQPFERVYSYFQYYIACGIDVKPVGNTSFYLILTTDNSDYYYSFKVDVYPQYSYGIDLSAKTFKKKSDNSTVNNITFNMQEVRRSSGTGITKDWLYYQFDNNSGNKAEFYLAANGYNGYRIYGYNASTSESYSNGVSLLVANDVPYVPTTDPYAEAGDSTTGGGGGTFDGSSDPVPVPSLPSVGATNTGFISLFVPSQAQLKQVADYLWSPLLDISTFKKIFENPMDCILGLSVVPVTIPTSGSAQITVGNVELSGISLPLASQQYVEVDCGSIPFTDKFFGSYLDQDPYTKMALFVPYSGVHSVKADDIMGKTVNLKYHIDILTGSLVAFLTCGNSVLYEFNGACASNIPVNSMNYASTIENAIRIAVNIGTTVATAGASAPLSGANAATREAARTFGTAVNMAGSTAEGILSLKPNIDRAGSLGGTTGLMGNQTPYFIITRPRLCKPANQNTFKGYPSFIQTSISDLIGEGYTEFDTVVLAGLYLTDGEKEELKQILESGVYL